MDREPHLGVGGSARSRHDDVRLAAAAGPTPTADDVAGRLVRAGRVDHPDAGDRSGTHCPEDAPAVDHPVL
jgi:hypothetical protein